MKVSGCHGFDFKGMGGMVSFAATGGPHKAPEGSERWKPLTVNPQTQPVGDPSESKGKAPEKMEMKN